MTQRLRPMSHGEVFVEGSQESAERERADEYAKEQCDVTATVPAVAPA